jgi:hypothetical protein
MFIFELRFYYADLLYSPTSASKQDAVEKSPIAEHRCRPNSQWTNHAIMTHNSSQTLALKLLLTSKAKAKMDCRLFCPAPIIRFRLFFNETKPKNRLIIAKIDVAGLQMEITLP